VLISDDLKKCVAFIAYYDFREDRHKLAGTAFFVSVPNEKLNGGSSYAVTARHLIGGLAKKGVEKVFIRVNLKENGTENIELPITNWSYHPDDSTDVAVALIRLGNEYDVDYLFVAEAATPQVMVDEALGIGDEIFLLGLLSNHSGQTRNLPILRVGNIAAMPGEPVNTKLGPTGAYLVETRSIAGFSGSPVFVNVRGIRQTPGKEDWFRFGKTIIWIGLMHGHYVSTPNDTNDFVEPDPDNGADTRQPMHTGISIVVPATKIIEALNTPELLKARQDMENAFLEIKKELGRSDKKS
jgi:hypothetical protein